MTAISIVTSLVFFISGLITSHHAARAAAGSLVAQGQPIEKELRAASGQKLTLDLQTGGGVKITGWAQDVVSVKASRGGRDWQDCTVDINPTADGVSVTSRYVGSQRNHSTSFDFEIQVPQRFDLQIHSAGGGLTISNVDGRMSGSTGGGSINITDARGEAHLSTGGGSITVKNSNLDGSVSTGGGRVLIEDVTGDLKGSSGGGNVVLKNVTYRSGKSTGDKVLISNAGGAINVDSAPSGADVRTGGGSVHIGAAHGPVKASTGGGSIDIDSVDGSVRATTGAGRVNVTVSGDNGEGNHDVYITSGTGDITLTLPASFSMEFDLKLGYTREDRNYQIISDFEMSKQATADWSSDEGTPRKYIYGTGSVAGGRNKIHISSVNGNIYIRRGQ